MNPIVHCPTKQLKSYFQKHSTTMKPKQTMEKGVLPYDIFTQENAKMEYEKRIGIRKTIHFIHIQKNLHFNVHKISLNPKTIMHILQDKFLKLN